MQLQTAERKRAKIKMGLQGPSGSGKTYSALLLAYGLCGDWTKIAVIDSENKSANLYAHLGNYKVLDIDAPFTPERYIESIQHCEREGMQVIIIDSISHEWDNQGGILDLHSNMTGNSFAAWAKLTPRHNDFIQTILQSPLHIIGTIRTKQDYILADKNGKLVPEKVGLKGITKDGLDYEMTLVFDLDIKNNASASKDRTSLFVGKPEFKITSETGQKILSWCNQPQENSQPIEARPINEKAVDAVMLHRINSCTTIDELIELFKSNPSIQVSMLAEFTRKRQLLTVKTDLKTIIKQKFSKNGTANNQ